MPATKCPCGCGQATREHTRMRKLECDGPGCKNHCRQSRQNLAFYAGMKCPCGGTLTPVCDLDRADAGDAYAAERVSAAVELAHHQSVNGRAGAQARARKGQIAERHRQRRAEMIERHGPTQIGWNNRLVHADGTPASVSGDVPW